MASKKRPRVFCDFDNCDNLNHQPLHENKRKLEFDIDDETSEQALENMDCSSNHSSSLLRLGPDVIGMVVGYIVHFEDLRHMALIPSLRESMINGTFIISLNCAPAAIVNFLHCGFFKQFKKLHTLELLSVEFQLGGLISADLPSTLTSLTIEESKFFNRPIIDDDFIDGITPKNNGKPLLYNLTSLLTLNLIVDDANESGPDICWETIAPNVETLSCCKMPNNVTFPMLTSLTVRKLKKFVAPNLTSLTVDTLSLSVYLDNEINNIQPLRGVTKLCLDGFFYMGKGWIHLSTMFPNVKTLVDRLNLWPENSIDLQRLMCDRLKEASYSFYLSDESWKYAPEKVLIEDSQTSLVLSLSGDGGPNLEHVPDMFDALILNCFVGSIPEKLCKSVRKLTYCQEFSTQVADEVLRLMMGLRHLEELTIAINNQDTCVLPNLIEAPHTHCLKVVHLCFDNLVLLYGNGDRGSLSSSICQFLMNLPQSVVDLQILLTSAMVYNEQFHYPCINSLVPFSYKMNDDWSWGGIGASVDCDIRLSTSSPVIQISFGQFIARMPNLRRLLLPMVTFTDLEFLQMEKPHENLAIFDATCLVTIPSDDTRRTIRDKLNSFFPSLLLLSLKVMSPVGIVTMGNTSQISLYQIRPKFSTPWRERNDLNGTNIMNGFSSVEMSYYNDCAGRVKYFRQNRWTTRKRYVDLDDV